MPFPNLLNRRRPICSLQSVGCYEFIRTRLMVGEKVIFLPSLGSQSGGMSTSTFLLGLCIAVCLVGIVYLLLRKNYQIERIGYSNRNSPASKNSSGDSKEPQLSILKGDIV